MIYLLDANVLITANRQYYPLERVPEFWDWLIYQGGLNSVKIVQEVYEEFSEGKDSLAKWAKQSSVKKSLLLKEEVEIKNVQKVTNEGYATNLSDIELEKLGRDPFLIAYALRDPQNRTIVTTEVSKPKRTRANKHIPDVCDTFNIIHYDTFQLTNKLNFTTNWKKSTP